MKRRFNKHWPFILLCLFHLAANFFWLIKDQTPPAWDQAAHLRISFLFHRWLTFSSRFSLLEIVRQSGGYPPLIHFLAGAWSLFAGANLDWLTFFHSFFLILTLVGLYQLSFLLTKNWRASFNAVLLFSFFPIIVEAGRNFLLDLPLTAWLVWALNFYFRSNFLAQRKESLLFVLCLVLASLTKLNGFIYFIPLVLFSFFQVVFRQKKKIFSHLVLIAGVYLLGVGWWWLVNYQNIFQYLTGLAGQGEPVTDPMNLLSWRTWIHYFKLFFLHQAMPLPAIIFLASLYLWQKREKNHQRRQLILLFLLGNYFIFTVIRNKDMRFTMPLLPAVAIIFAFGLRQIKRINLRVYQLISLLLIVYLGLHYLVNSFDWPFKKEYHLAVKTFLLGDVDLINFSDYPLHSPKTQAWPQEKILTDLARLAIEERRKIKVLVLINREEVNDNNLALWRELLGLDGLIDFGSVGPRSRFESQKGFISHLKNFDYVLLPDSNYQPAPFYGINLEAYRQARDFILTHWESFSFLSQYQVFDNKKLFLVKVNPSLF